MRLIYGLALATGLITHGVDAAPVELNAGAVTWLIDPQTVEIEARESGDIVPVMPALHASQATHAVLEGKGWTWQDANGQVFHASMEGEALHLTITAKVGSVSWALPKADRGIWLVPDGEGIAYGASDPFWRAAYAEEECLGGTPLLSFPAWSYLTNARAVTYALGDGFQSALCLKDEDGLQARLTHDFTDGAETLDLLFALRTPEPLAPAFFYRQVLQARGQLTTFADKIVPDLPRLFAAPEIYVWGDGRDLAFLDDLQALGIERVVISYDQDPKSHPKLVTPPYLKKAYAQGYLAGPYEAFENGQSPETADTPVAVWDADLYPAGCLRDRAGKIVSGFANRGCEMSSEAIARHPQGISPASRYAGHIVDGASQVFVDVDAFGEFYDDFNPAMPMTMARDRQNRLDRLGLGITKYKLVLGSENVTAWSHGVAHYSHGTAQAHVSPIWMIQKDKTRFGTWWPSGRPELFFKPITLTPDELRATFAPVDRLPLFEAIFHDSVVTSDRWEFPIMKVAGAERQRFARALLYGAPTMWSLDRTELQRVGPWLRAAQDEFALAHGTGTPDALTRFQWLTPDHLVQQATYADGRILTANFGDSVWQGLLSNCVRLTRSGQAPADLCPPADPPAYKPPVKR